MIRVVHIAPAHPDRHSGVISRSIRSVTTATAAALTVRAAGSGPIKGYALLWDSPTDIGDYSEVIRRGALDRSLRENPDVRALWNHDTGAVIGRTTAGTLRLSVDDIGLRFEIDLPSSPLGANVREAVNRGDVTGMSFGFSVAPGGDRWSRLSSGQRLRELIDINLIEISPVTFPAYKAASVSA